MNYTKATLWIKYNCTFPRCLSWCSLEFPFAKQMLCFLIHILKVVESHTADHIICSSWLCWVSVIMTVLFPNIPNPTDNLRMFEMLAFVERPFRHSLACLFCLWAATPGNSKGRNQWQVVIWSMHTLFLIERTALIALSTPQIPYISIISLTSVCPEEPLLIITYIQNISSTSGL